jgi:hypothetical protein
MTEDARIPVVVEADPAGPLAPGDCRLALPVGHGGLNGPCACCPPRSAAGRALALLFLRQVRGEREACRRVVVSGHDAAAIRDALATDVLASARFRFAGALAGTQPA